MHKSLQSYTLWILQDGRDNGPSSLPRAVVPFRDALPLILWESKTGEENETFSSKRSVILTVFLCLGFLGLGQNPATLPSLDLQYDNQKRLVFLTTGRDALRIALP